MNLAFPGRRACAWVGLATALLSCTREDPPVTVAALPAGETLVAVVEAGGADPLLSYAWDGGPPTPATFAGEEASLDWGQARFEEEARLLVPFDEGAGAVARDVAAPDRSIELRDCEWTGGRFGSAIDVSDGRVSVSGGTPVFTDEWTLDLWIRPAPSSRRREELVLRGPDPLELVLGAGGRLRLRSREGGFEAASPPLPPGEWSHVAIVWYPEDLPLLRLVVNGEADGGHRPPDLALPDDAELALGGGDDSLPGFAGAVDDLRVVGHATSTNRLAEHAAARAPVGWHELVLARASGERRAVLWSGAPHALEIAGEDLSRGALVHAVADGTGLRWAEGHWERDRVGRAPLPRTTHPTVYAGNHLVFVFGGETRDSTYSPWANTNDTWLYRTDLRSWSRVESPEGPPPSCHQSAAYSPEHGIVLYPGGWRNDDRGSLTYSEVWAFHVEEERWERRADAPRPLANCGVVYHEGLKVFLVLRRGMVLAYDPSRDRWHVPRPPAAFDAAGRPTDFDACGSCAVAYDPRSQLVLLFGGECHAKDDSGYHDRTALYDARAHAFLVPETDLRPAARARAAIAHDPQRDRFVLFGGVRNQFSNRFDDLWSYRIDEGWTRHDASNAPSARGGYYGMAYDPELDRFHVLCGRHSRERFLDEAWRLALDPRADGEATYVLERMDAASARFLEVDAEGPDRERIAVALRGTTDDGTWMEWSEERAGAVPAGRHLAVRVRIPAGADLRVVRIGFGSESGELPSGVHRVRRPLPDPR